MLNLTVYNDRHKLVVQLLPRVGIFAYWRGVGVIRLSFNPLLFGVWCFLKCRILKYGAPRNMRRARLFSSRYLRHVDTN